MSQPESTERCAVCLRDKMLGGIATHRSRCGRGVEGEDAYNEGSTECYRLGYGRVSRALAEAETLKRISDSQAHEAWIERDEAWIERDGALARLAEAEKERDELVRDFLNYKTATRAAAERAAQAERALRERGVHDRDCAAYRVPGRFGSQEGLRWNQSTDPLTCTCPLGVAILGCELGKTPSAGRAKPRAAASEAFDSKALNAGGGAQGEEK